jgi:hypothetical protein
LRCRAWWNFRIAFALWLIWFGVFAFYTLRYIRGLRKPADIAPQDEMEETRTLQAA